MATLVWTNRFNREVKHAGMDGWIMHEMHKDGMLLVAEDELDEETYTLAPGVTIEEIENLYGYDLED